MRHIKTALTAVLGFFLLTAISGCLFDSGNNQNAADDEGPVAPGGQEQPGTENPPSDEDQQTAGRTNLFVLNQPIPVFSPLCVNSQGQNFGGTAFAIIFEIVENRLFEPLFGEFIVNDANGDGFGDDVSCVENPLPPAPFVATQQNQIQYQPGDVAILVFNPNVANPQIRWTNLTTGQVLAQFANQTTINFPIPANAKSNHTVIQVEAQLLFDGNPPDSTQFQDPENTRFVFDLPIRPRMTANLRPLFFPNNMAVALPDGINVAPPAEQPKDNFQGATFNADPPPAPDGTPPATENDLSGYMSVLTARLGLMQPDGSVTEAKTAQEVAQAQSSQISNIEGVEATNQGSVSPAADVVLTKLGLELPAGDAKSNHRMTTRELRNMVLSRIGASTPGASLSLPAVQRTAREQLDNRFTLYMGVRTLPNGRIFNAVIIVRQSLDRSLGPLAELSRDARQLLPRDQFFNSFEAMNSFTAEQADQADFLFAIDNSGSMGDEQQTLQAAANNFVDALDLSGLDYRVGVVTTDRSDLQRGGYFSPAAPLSVLRDILVPGIFGSGTESAIFFAEQSLMDTRLGDAADGSSTTNVTDSGLLTGANGGQGGGAQPEPIPRRANDPSLELLGSMSVILVSDELDQYSAYSGGRAFDPANNLFTGREYTVHTIIDQAAETRDETGGQNQSQYRELSQQTTGLTAEIGDQAAFENLLVEIVQIAGGLSSRIDLQPEGLSAEELERVEIVPASLIVQVDGQPVPRSRENGYEFNVVANRVVFFGNAVPAPGQAIKVIYRYRLRPEI